MTFPSESPFAKGLFEPTEPREGVDAALAEIERRAGDRRLAAARAQQRNDVIARIREAVDDSRFLDNPEHRAEGLIVIDEILADAGY